MPFRVMRGALILAVGLLAGCSDSTGPSLQEELLTSAIRKWSETGPASYEMILLRTCACPGIPAVRIIVRNKVVESRTYTGTGDPVPPEDADDFPDVPGLFALVKKAMDEDYYLFSVAYDPTYGYPSSLQLDPDASTLEDNVNFQVVELQPIGTP